MFPFTRYAALTLDRPRWTTKRRAVRHAARFAADTGNEVEIMRRTRHGYSHAGSVVAYRRY